MNDAYCKIYPNEHFPNKKKENFRVFLDENETYDKVADIILQKNGIKNYKRYIDNMFMNRTIEIHL